MEAAEYNYFKLIEQRATPQEARSVLPNSLKTEVVMTANLRELRHFFKLRCSKAAHPQMREIAIPLLKELREKIPIVFDDIILED
jgi:thymidylate synthase (FAD)